MKNFHPAYANANKLTVTSKFTYLGVEYTVTNIGRASIKAVGSNSQEITLKAHEFEAYIYYGFAKISF